MSKVGEMMGNGGKGKVAVVAGVDKNTLTAFVETIIEDIYNDTPKA